MKKLRYYSEKTIWFYLAIFLITEGCFICVLTDKRQNTRETILLAAAVGIILLIEIAKGLHQMYTKHRCIKYGTAYKGRIVGKFGHNTMKSGYFYQLLVLYKNGKITTPLIEAKYVDKLKYRRCKVYEYSGMTYADGFTLCEKGEAPAKIQIVHKPSK